MTTRREILAAGTSLLGLTALPAIAGSRRSRTSSDFVTVAGHGFRLHGKPYRYVGANMWYAAYLGADTAYGDRARLGRELDRLVALGIDNVRVLGASEDSPLIGAISPAFRGKTDVYNPDLLAGLDWFLAELGKRGMRAVIYLNNFWEWSGGMMTYLSWVNGGKYIDAHDPAHPWPEFADYTAGFYTHPRAVALYHAYVCALVGRTNGVTGRRYADDPAIMAWQLANEPRPGESPATTARILPAYQAWIRKTARLIRSIDANHLVSSGAEGTIGCANSMACVADAAAPVDYMTIHIWPQNFGWIDPADLAGTRAVGEAKTLAYIRDHRALAVKLGKPLVIEEFGYPRDAGYAPGTPTIHRDGYYRLIMESVAADARAGGPLAGLNFWAWNGEGRAQHPDHRFRTGDRSYLGDPPHEPQGWYGVFDQDMTTKRLIRRYATAFARSAEAALGHVNPAIAWPICRLAL
ncbi:Mannan endo-1,4-beta-mannosidase [Sphingomonas sp. EC-HK361]|uniref:glycoside hydrolase 5 family protein n=1 Tax=Sphingomonas sp. EC-HK361 TaxID=2038397 RepID=UPI00125A6AB6|nr:cellulase family glycosylhydrolase [Sphingomonas sp. EC-HK361]VVT22045.1 Mannan endo-1,4-beta-mannosidase [Sphingomonas sp. EC-HK361]